MTWPLLVIGTVVVVLWCAEERRWARVRERVADRAGYERGRRHGEALGEARYRGRRSADVVAGRLPPTLTWGEAAGRVCFEFGPPGQLEEKDRREWWERFHAAADERWEEIRGRRATEKGEAS